MEDEYSDDYLRSCVNLYLRCIGYDFELLTKKQQQYILKAEESISNKFRVVHDAKNLLSSAKITGTGIEQDLGISHQTYYNNKVLMDYVDFRAKDFAKYKAPIKKTYSSDEVAVLKEEITALHQRDVEYQELKLQLADAMKHISRLTDQIDKKAQGIHYQFGIKPSKHKVIHLHKSLKIVSWNVNGFSSCVEKGFFDFFLNENADIYCLQEIRIKEGTASVSIKDYQVFWNYSKKKGHSGTAIISRYPPISVINGLGNPVFDNEGRIQTAEFNNFYLVNLYSPQTQADGARLQYRSRWEKALRAYVISLEQQKPVILCGDFNVAYTDMDVEEPWVTGSSPGISPSERLMFSQLLDAGYDDAFRLLYPQKYHVYSWWPYAANNRYNNIGLRLDYFLLSKQFKDRLIEVSYLDKILGSDHCPLSMMLRI